MNRKQFIRNLLATAAAVTIAPAIEPWVLEESVPGIGMSTFKIYFSPSTLRVFDIIQSSTGEIFMVSSDKGKLVAVSADRDVPNFEIIEMEGYQQNVTRIANCMPEPDEYPEDADQPYEKPNQIKIGETPEDWEKT